MIIQLILLIVTFFLASCGLAETTADAMAVTGDAAANIEKAVQNYYERPDPVTP
ncbi:MAG TPA: hypothetical protein VK612_06085 [Pyrinomonadaceae bacterium]|nr:hypothetical protein [Pyrinomonadaceae bacterium]